ALAGRPGCSRGPRRPHRSLGGARGARPAAGDALGATCLIKPHPAESDDDYARALREARARRTRVLPATADLLRLLHAADVLVTVESLSAVEAIVLDKPVVILNAPTNLREMVEEGVALAVPAGDDPTDALRRALSDGPTREALAAARARYRPQIAYGEDGRATARILALVREVAAGSAGTARAGGHGRVREP